MLRLAVPLAFSATIPSVVVPSLNVTTPVGVPAAPVTPAESTTVCPNVAGFGAPLSVVAEGRRTRSVSEAALPT